MPKSLAKRIQESFDNEPIRDVKKQAGPAADSKDRSSLLIDVKEYTNQLYNAWADSCKSVNQKAILVLVLMALFELLTYQSKAQEFTIGSITLANSSIVQTCLPPIVAFLVYDLYVLTERVSNMENAYTEIMKQFGLKLYSNDLHLLVAPLLPSFWSPANSLQDENARSVDRFMDGASAIFSFAALAIFPTAFEVQAFYHLFGKFGFGNPLLWANAAITGILLVCSAYVFWGD